MLLFVDFYSLCYYSMYICNHNNRCETDYDTVMA